MMVKLYKELAVPDSEIELSAIRSSGPGGQNVNKVATGIHLRFDIQASSLPDPVKRRLLRLSDQRINSSGVVVIKAQNYRRQEQNREAALDRLRDLLAQALVTRKPRRPTRPSKAARKRRMDSKKRRGATKNLRQPPKL